MCVCINSSSVKFLDKITDHCVADPLERIIGTSHDSLSLNLGSTRSIPIRSGRRRYVILDQDRFIKEINQIGYEQLGYTTNKRVQATNCFSLVAAASVTIPITPIKTAAQQISILLQLPSTLKVLG